MDYSSLTSEQLIQLIKELESRQLPSQQTDSNVLQQPAATVFQPPTLLRVHSTTTVATNEPIRTPQPVTTVPTFISTVDVSDEQASSPLPSIFESTDPDLIIDQLKKCKDVGSNKKKSSTKPTKSGIC